MEKAREPKSEAYKRFRSVAILVRAVTILTKETNKKSNELTDVTPYLTFNEYIDQMKQMSETYIRATGFDPLLFRANRQLRIPKETKRILTLPPEERTTQQTEKTMLTLRMIKAFSEYPKRMQRKLVDVCWYENHAKKKIILQQGHPPRAFYFILSGKVSVKVRSKNETFARTVCYLDRGKSFGELAIVHGTIRQATIITESETEFLCVSKEDFVKIFMTSPEGKNMHDPDFLSFVRELKFMDGWPIELLQKKRKDCLFFYFKSGEVLVKDSKYSSWLYIIKSGSCDILKKLQKVQTSPQVMKMECRYGVPPWSSSPRINCRIPEQRRIQSASVTSRLAIPREKDNVFLVTKLNIKPKAKKSKQQSQKSTTVEQNISQRISVLDHNATRSPVQFQKTPDSKVCFVKIATLQKGESFGLQEMLHGDQPSMILVSNGAEILMVSKKLYQQHASKDLLLHLRRATHLFPADEKLQRELETTVQWDTFKKQQMNTLLAGCRVERIKQRRCRTAHI